MMRAVGPPQGYEGPESWLRYSALSRFAVVAFVTTGAAFISGAIDAGWFVLLYVLWFGPSLFYSRTLYQRKTVGPRATWLQILVDFTLVAVIVSSTHGPTSFFTFIFVIVVLEAGVLLGIRQGFAIATASSLLMAALFLWHYVLDATPTGSAGRSGASTFEQWYNFVVQCLAYYLTAFISGYWNQRLRRMQQFQREILDNMNSGFLITDSTGYVVIQNRAADRILDLQRAAAIGRPVSEILKVASGGECPVITALRTGGDFTSYEFRARTASGRTCLIGLTTNRIKDPDGDVRGLIASFTDLTFMDEMRQEMRRQDRMAVVGELAAGLAHEIRNPVAVIRGAVDEMQSIEAQGPMTEKLRAIALRESDHLNEIVSGFLDFARQPELKRETFDLRIVVDEVRELVERELAKNGQLAVLSHSPAAPCLVSGDASKIRQVCVNLGKNSVEAMRGKGTLTITLRKSAGPLELLFEDDGPGIPPDLVDRIFEPFFTTKNSGVGMGLAVCARIITAHDGTISAATREGGGGAILVRLPEAHEEDKP